MAESVGPAHSAFSRLDETGISVRCKKSAITLTLIFISVHSLTASNPALSFSLPASLSARRVLARFAFPAVA
jgi:hypothetical protein